MKSQPLLSLAAIEQLLDQRSIVDEHPWTSGDNAVEAHLKAVCAAVARATAAHSRIEWNHYGSGYASFVDAWFYKREPGFAVKQPLDYEDEHIGLVVLFSRLSRYFVFMEGEKRWDKRRATSYLPAFEMVDRFGSSAVAKLGEEVQRVLESFKLIRVYRGSLEEPLPSDISVATNLADRGFTQFDALFHWDD